MTGEHLALVREHFTRTAETYARLTQATQERGLHSLVRLARTETTDRVLDVACGPGLLTMAFAEGCSHAIGFDATDAFLEFARAEARKRGLGNISFEHGDAQQLPFVANAFEVVSCRAAFHHFPAPERVLLEMVRVMTQGGRIMIADLVGNEDPVKAALHDRVERMCDPTHVRALPSSELERIFQRAGLRIIAKSSTTLHYDVEEWISNGVPTQAVHDQIIAFMESTIEHDDAGLRVRREEGRLRFSHDGACYVLQF